MDRRSYPRTQVSVDIEVAQPGQAVCYGCALDVSGTGAYVHIWAGPAPRVGDRIIVQFKIWTGRERISRQLRSEVARLTPHGFGVEFMDVDAVTEAVVHDILYYLQFERRSAPRPPRHLIDSAAPLPAPEMATRVEPTTLSN